jgi:hypothetical protein
MTILLLALASPLLVLAWGACRDLPRTAADWKARALPIAILFAAGIYAANPFLAGTASGSGEAYNYSLSLADAVTQFRAGVFPVLVGQTEFAFNGRIHPLRTAPYYCYAPGLLDLLTFRRLDFWQLQCLLLTLSLVGAAFSAYAALRHLAGTTARVALYGAVVFVFSPAVLSLVYSMDLYMTVTTLPFLPLALGAGVYSFRERSARVYLLMGITLGLIWLAHPPIALWASAATVVLQAVVWLTRRPTWAAFAGLAAGVAAGGGLIAFGFASTLTMQSAGDLSSAKDFSPMFTEMKRVFPAALLPVGARADYLSAFQLGYVLWALLLATLGAAVWRRRLDALTLLGLACFLLVLTLPVPGISENLWHLLPDVFPNLTNIWPMQRLYLVAAVLILLAGGLLWGDTDTRLAARPGLARVANYLLLAALGWTLWQAQPFLDRGNMTVRSRTVGRDLHRSENINLTVTSYAMLGIPPYFVNGVMDPHQAFRLLRDADRSELANNWTAADPGPVKARGTLRGVRPQPDEVPLTPTLHLEPGARYLLSLTFRTAPFTGHLVLTGEHFNREYFLPSAGEPRAFGMRPGNQHSIVLWTTNPSGADINLRINGAAVSRSVSGAFADFTLHQIDPKRYPVQLESLVPLRGRFQSTEAGWLETPRRFIPGYAATVDGAPATIGGSPGGALMLQVPAGDHAFELRYVGPPLLRAAFWTTFMTVLLLVLGIAGWAAITAIRRLRSQLG